MKKNGKPSLRVVPPATDTWPECLESDPDLPPRMAAAYRAIERIVARVMPLPTESESAMEWRTELSIAMHAARLGVNQVAPPQTLAHVLGLVCATYQALRETHAHCEACLARQQAGHPPRPDHGGEA